MSMAKSKIIGDKPHLWELAQALKKQIAPSMEEIYGDPKVAMKGSDLIRAHVANEVLVPSDRKSLESWLFTSFMAKNGFHLKKESSTMREDPLDDIYERLSQIEARLGIVPK